MPADLSRLDRTVGRYLLFGQFGAGGMARVHLGRLVGPAGFSRLVAIKRMHPHLVKERAFVDAFLDEARIAARIHHPNVVATHDVAIDGDEVLLVMDYVHGRALSQLVAGPDGPDDAARRVPPGVAVAIAVDVLHGLHAAHSARDERGKPLGLVHRDVSPQNVLVGVDGVARVLDFGIAKAFGRLAATTNGDVKGKLAYMAPERLLDDTATASVDIYGAAIVIWEMLAGERYFGRASDPSLLPKVMEPTYRPLPGTDLGALDEPLRRALHRQATQRFATAKAFAEALESAYKAGSRTDVAAWVESVAGAELRERSELIEEIERSSIPSMPAAGEVATPPLSGGSTDAEATRTERPVHHAPADASVGGRREETNQAVVTHAKGLERTERSPRRTVMAALLLAAGVTLGVGASMSFGPGARAVEATTPTSPPAVGQATTTTPSPTGVAPTQEPDALPRTTAPSSAATTTGTHRPTAPPQSAAAPVLLSTDAGTTRPDASRPADLDTPSDRK